MKILRLRAQFGKLNGVLELQPGMNLLHLPNEAGKSTWSAFIVAMLYGIDTRERRNSENQGLPAKERYQPWDGGAMEGAMELEWQGRRITLERTSTARAPMGVFRAYETASGAPIPELTADNCGKILCGVERSVFERTAFIRQLGLAVTGDARLEQRLGALVSTGEDGAKAYSELEQTLRTKKNQLLGRSGRLPALQRREAELRSSLDGLRAKQEELLQLAEQRAPAAAEQAQSEELLARIERAKAAKNYAALDDISKQLEAQEALCSRLEKSAADLPSDAELQSLQRTLTAAENELETAKLDLAFSTARVAPLPTPPCYKGMDAAEVMGQTAVDLIKYKQLTEVPPFKPLKMLLCCAAALICGVLISLLYLKQGLIVIGAGLIALTIVLILLKNREKIAQKRREKGAKIMAFYGVNTLDEMTDLATNYAKSLLLPPDADPALQEAVTAAQDKVDALVERTKAFAPQCVTSADCREALSAAIHAHERLAGERRTCETLRRQREVLVSAFGAAAQAAQDPEALTLDEAKIKYEYHRAEQRVSELTIRAAELQGTVSAVGDAVAMEAELERLRDEIAAVQERGTAIDLALDALKAADETLRSRFSPQVTAEAGNILAALTDGKYPAVLLEPEMHLSVREEDGVLMRPAAAMSCGTADQMYLALRLAMCRLLLPAEAPLILDDALVNFDETRARAALHLLRTEAKQRQVLLFTCRNFENEE